MTSFLDANTWPVLAQMALLATWLTLMVCWTSWAEALATAEMILSLLELTSLVTKLFLSLSFESMLLAAWICSMIWVNPS